MEHHPLSARRSRHTGRWPQAVLSIVAGVALLVSFVGWGVAATTAYATTATVTTWTDLQTAFASSGTVTLGQDITAPSGSNLVMTAATTVTLDLNGHALSITSPPIGSAAVQDTGATLTIEDPTGNGVLTATGSGDGNGGAGIGGSPGTGSGSVGNGGTVTITGGTVNATGGGANTLDSDSDSAGIGGGEFDTDSGSVTITGGKVTADGGGAGIGGGRGGPGAVVLISGGTVTATGGAGAGIGSGNVNCGSTTSAGSITITGGTVLAVSNDGAGIGGGSCGDGGDVSIGSGAIVDAESFTDTSIGSGGEGNTVFGSLSNSGSLTFDRSVTGEVVPPTVTVSNGEFTNNLGGVITLGNMLGGGGTVVNNGTIVIGSGGSVASDGTTVTEHDYPVTYNLNGMSGTAPQSQTVYAASFDDAMLALPALPTGQVWSDAASGGATVTDATDLTGSFGESATGATPVTLYLTAVPETVTFDPENAQASTTETVPYGSDAARPADPVRTGFVFDGWFTAPTGGSLYDFSAPVTSSFTVYAQWALAAVPVSVSGSQTFGGTASFTPTPIGSLPPGVSLSGSATCTTVNRGVPITPALSPVELYTIDGSSCSGLSLSGPNAANYLVSLTGGGFTVNPATVAVSVSGLQTFGGSPTFSTSQSLPPGISLSGSVTCTTVDGGTPISASLAVAGYTIDGASCSGLSLSGTNAADYVLSLTGGAFTVTPAPIAVTVSGSQTFGGSPSFSTSQSLPPGISFSGSVACTTVNGGTAITSTLSAGGTYTIDGASCSGLSLAGTVSSNYVVAYTGGAFTVTKATPAIAWPPPASIVYGTALSATQLDATATTSVGGQMVSVAGSFTYTPAAGAVLHAGSQTLSTTFTPSDSVDFTTATATVALTVTPAPLTVTANNASQVFGQPIPVFSVSYRGFVNGDGPASLTGTLTLTTPATSASPPGVYPIVPSGLSSPDYTITYVDGTLTVTKAPTTTSVSVSPAKATLGGLVTFTATVAAAQANQSGVNPTGNVAFYLNGATSPVATVMLTAAGTAVFQTTLPGGTTTVSAAYSGDPDFLASATTTPATATIACSGQTITGTQTGTVIASKGLTCFSGAQFTGSIIVEPGASLDVENSTVNGSIAATGATSVRLCATSVNGAVSINGSTGFVLVGDPGEDHCAPNTFGDGLIVENNTGGLVVVDNTVTGTIGSVGNRGAGPFPDQTAPDITGNHP